jgi:protein CpxP
MKTFIKTILATTLFMSAGLISAGTAFAQDTDYETRKSSSEHRGQRSMQSMPMVEKLTRALHRLDLSEEQRTSIKAVMQEMKADIRPIMGDMKAGQLQLKTLINSDVYDEDAVAELARIEGDLAAERIVISSRALADVLGYLSDEQRAELDQMAEKRKQRQGGKRGQREDVS